jgi:nucleoside-diphosphate-sugar epimerase
MPETPQGVELVAGDLSDPSQVRDLASEAAVVYQCAKPPYHKWPELFPALQAAVIAGLTGSRAKLVIGDNLYLYGDTGGRSLSEDTPPTARTRKGRTRADMAAAALEAHQAGRLRVAIGRASTFFGPWVRDSTMGERVFEPALNGKKAQLVGRLDQPHTLTYIEDFGRALVILGEREEADGQAWHVPNDRPEITQAEFVELIFEELGRPAKMSGMGKLVMAIGGLFIPEARESLEMMYEFERPLVVDSSRFERTFGLQATPLKEAIRATVTWYRAQASGPKY